MIILWIIAQWSTERTTEIKELCEFQNNKWTDAHKLVMQAKAALLKKKKSKSAIKHTLLFKQHTVRDVSGPPPPHHPPASRVLLSAFSSLLIISTMGIVQLGQNRTIEQLAVHPTPTLLLEDFTQRHKITWGRTQTVSRR